MNGTLRRVASRVLLATSRILPPQLSSWPRAMRSELAQIPDDRAALAFAVGCLRAACALAITVRLASARGFLFPPKPSVWSFLTMNGILVRPRLLGLGCGAGAVTLGLAYMIAAGAPSRYLLVNLTALVLGATAWLALARTARSSLTGAGAPVFALAVPLMLTALFGAESQGASRWVSVGPLYVQSSLVVLPVMVVLYARRPDAIGAVGMALAALELAVQPDRAMAGVLLSGLSVLALATRSRLPFMATAAALPAFGWTLLAPDTLPAMPYVDRIFYTAFGVHPLAGVAVVAGAGALIMPAIIGALQATGERPTLLAFGGCWAGVVIAAALGNYPTPLVGYGGGAVLGYLLSAALLPIGAGEPGRLDVGGSEAGVDRRRDRATSELWTAIPA